MSAENRDPRVDPEIVGRSLEEARKSKGLTLQEVEQETRIRSRYLRDLEQENFDVLPAVYVLGSLKTYADFLGLDGAALSRQLKASLVEPAEPDVPEQLAALRETRDEDDEYEAAPVPAVGFDQLFLGMGVILISILAVMTIVAAVAQGYESPISQVDQPSTPESPSEIALAGNVLDGDGVKGAGDGDPVNDENREDQPEAAKGNEDGEASKDEVENDDGEASQSAPIFGDAEFVPVSPSSSSPADASASASTAPASTAPQTVEPDDVPASTAPASNAPASAAPGSTAPASSGAPQGPSESAPSAAALAPSGGASPRTGGRSRGDAGGRVELQSDFHRSGQKGGRGFREGRHRPLAAPAADDLGVSHLERVRDAWD